MARPPGEGGRDPDRRRSCGRRWSAARTEGREGRRETEKNTGADHGNDPSRRMRRRGRGRQHAASSHAQLPHGRVGWAPRCSAAALLCRRGARRGPPATQLGCGRSGIRRARPNRSNRPLKATRHPHLSASRHLGTAVAVRPTRSRAATPAGAICGAGALAPCWRARLKSFCVSVSLFASKSGGLGLRSHWGYMVGTLSALAVVTVVRVVDRLTRMLRPRRRMPASRLPLAPTCLLASARATLDAYHLSVPSCLSRTMDPPLPLLVVPLCIACPRPFSRCPASLIPGRPQLLRRARVTLGPPLLSAAAGRPPPGGWSAPCRQTLFARRQPAARVTRWRRATAARVVATWGFHEGYLVVCWSVGGDVTVACGEQRARARAVVRILARAVPFLH